MWPSRKDVTSVTFPDLKVSVSWTMIYVYTRWLTRGFCFEATAPPSWHSPTVKKIYLGSYRNAFINVYTCFCHIYTITLMETLKWLCELNIKIQMTKYTNIQKSWSPQPSQKILRFYVSCSIEIVSCSNKILLSFKQLIILFKKYNCSLSN